MKKYSAAILSLLALSLSASAFAGEGTHFTCGASIRQVAKRPSGEVVLLDQYPLNARGTTVKLPFTSTLGDSHKKAESVLKFSNNYQIIIDMEVSTDENSPHGLLVMNTLLQRVESNGMITVIGSATDESDWTKGVDDAANKKVKVSQLPSAQVDFKNSEVLTIAANQGNVHAAASELLARGLLPLGLVISAHLQCEVSD